MVAYSAVNNFLKYNKILAPKLFEQNYSKGTMIIEDFGDLTFSKLLLKQKNISHGFFNRNGGKSTGIYKSLNCGLGSNDKKKELKKT